MKYMITLNGKNYEVEVEQSEAKLLAVTDVPAAAQPAAVSAPAPAAPAAAPVAAPAVSGEKVLAPMPGTILKVNVAQGQAVKAGQVLVVLEAMKMETEIAAAQDGVVKQVLVHKGSAINTDDVLIVM
jgi:glutaconyl-CoA decarboxylase